MDKLYEQFITERRYLKNVSNATESWYRYSWIALGKPVLAKEPPVVPSKADWAAQVSTLRLRGVSATSVNTYSRAINAFLNWATAEGHFQTRPELIPKLKEEQKVLATLTEAQVKKLLAFKPKSFTKRRIHAATCLLLDSGMRIAEALALTPADIDFDNLLIKVRGKGNKHRIVPMSYEARKRLWLYHNKTDAAMPEFGPAHHHYFFGTRSNTRMTVRNFERTFKLMGERLGIVGVRMSPHTLRHTFAVSYLRNGGNLFYLSKILGHSSVTTTEKYLRALGVEDIAAVHNKFSLLSRGPSPE